MLRRFQWKYTSYLLGATLISILAIGGSTLFMNYQNYEIFSTIAARHAPKLLANLEREREWINGFLVTTTLAIILVYTLLGIQMTSRMIIPILLLQRHIKRFTRGDLTQLKIRIRESDEFQDLIDTYNYFYNSIQLQTQQDLTRLQSIPIDPRNREAQRTIEDMISERIAQLGLLDKPESIEAETGRSSDIQSQKQSVESFNENKDRTERTRAS